MVDYWSTFGNDLEFKKGLPEYVIVWYLQGTYCVEFFTKNRSDSVRINNRNKDELFDLIRFLKRGGDAERDITECALCCRDRISHCNKIIEEDTFHICSRCAQGICAPCVYKLDTFVKKIPCNDCKTTHHSDFYSCPFCKKDTHLKYDVFGHLKDDLHAMYDTLSCKGCRVDMERLFLEYPEYTMPSHTHEPKRLCGSKYP